MSSFLRLLTRVFFVVVVFSLALTACSGGRTPAPKTARHVALSYYKHYGSRFPTTVYGSKNVRNVTINAIEEVSYKFALVDSLVDFVDNHQARALIKMERKFPGGWQVDSWEVLGYR